jgi:hypothetical protein
MIMVSTGASRQPISVRQNSENSLLLVRAQSWYYNRAKKWYALKFAGILLFALAAPVVLFLAPGIAEWVGALAGAWVLAGRTFLSSLDRRSQHKAVKIHEQFDVELFDLEWNESLAGPKAGIEDIVTAARRVDGADELEKLKNWYADTGNAPWPINVLLCQRSSAAWGRRLHSRYGVLVLVLGLAWFLVGLALAVLAHATVANYLIMVFLPSQPAFLDAIDLYRGHLALSKEKEALEIEATNLLDLSLKTPGLVTALDCRSIQDQSFRIRWLGLPIPKIMYKVFRNTDEEAMRVGVALRLKSGFINTTEMP